MPAGRPLKFKTVEELQGKIDAYFDYCDETIVKRVVKKTGELIYEVTKPYTITGLAEYLGTSRQTLLEYEGEVKGREEKSKDYADTIKNAKAKIEACYEERALIGDNNPIVSIFTLKNNFNWKDKTEQDITSGNKPISILGGITQKDVSSDNSDKKDNGDAEAHPGNSGGNISQQDNIDTLIPD